MLAPIATPSTLCAGGFDEEDDEFDMEGEKQIKT
jgi:hypothetical protein